MQYVTSIALSLLVLLALGPAPADAREVLRQDAEQYAATFDVALDEALARLELQGSIGELQAELEALGPATFGGLFVEHEPAQRIVVQLTPEGGAMLDQIVAAGRYPELQPFLEQRTVERPLAALETLLGAALDAARDHQVPLDASIGVVENRVELYTTEPAELLVALEAAGLGAHLEAIAIFEVPALAEPARYLNGGHSLSTCTSGFSVQNSSGTRGILTAGHCGNTQAFNARTLSFRSEAYYGSYDVQWHTPGSAELHVTNRIWDGLYDSSTPYYRYITGTTPRSSQYIGQYVCKYGKTTGATCGTISSKSFAPGYVPYVSPTYIVVTSSTTDQSEPGDSGGPWYSGSSAFGVMSGHFTYNNDAIYTAIDYAAGVGVTVMTTTPPLDAARFTFRSMGNAPFVYTEIDANDYECSLAGMAALDGDIQEHDAGDIIYAFLSTYSNHFDFQANFRTHGDHESWDFDLLCLRRSAFDVTRVRFGNLGNNPSINTGLSSSSWECGIGGFAALDGDIQEHDSGDIIEAYAYRSGGQWWMHANFRSHKNNETWDLDAFCVDRSNPVIRYEYKGLGDNVNGYNTWIDSSTYVCGVAGIAARSGDINEGGAGDIIQTYLYESGGTWRIRADFRTHKDSESWDIDVLCVAR